MVKVLVVESTIFGYDGITNVIVNYYTYMDHSRIKMDFVTINPISDSFQDKLSKYGNCHYELRDRNNNPVKYVMKLADILKKGEYNILHVHGCSSTMAVEMLAGKLAGVKVRISHSHNTKCDHVKADKILRPFFERWCNVRFACGKEAGEWLFPNGNFHVVSNGIDLNRFAYDEEVRKEFRKQYNLEGNIVIGHVGRFSEQKNHKKLIEIYQAYKIKNPAAKLVLIGDGELRPQIEEETKALNLDVLYVGQSDEVEKWLQAIDIIVFPSLFEGLPLGLVEAQAAGLPCLLSDTISSTTKITDLVEFVPLSADPIVWCEKIDAAVNHFDRAQRRDFVEEQIRREQFDIRQNCNDLADIYEKFIDKVEKKEK